MTVAQLIATLIPVLLQVTPQLVKDVADLIHGNPQQQGEADDAYIARLNAQIDANAKVVAAEDAAIENG